MASRRVRRKPALTVPYVDTSTADFDSHLILLPAAASSSASPSMSSALSDAAADDIIADQSAEGEQIEEDVQLVSDDAAHAAGRKQPKRKAAPAASSAAAASKKAKLGKWQHAEDLALLEAIKQFVIANKGQLPGPVRTVASSVCTKPWITIAKGVAKVNELSSDAGGKACSARWTALRTSAKVRQTCEMANTARCLMRLSAHLQCFAL